MTMSRRDFVAGAGAAAVAASTTLVSSSSRAAVPVALAMGKDPAALIRRVLRELGGISRFVRRGDRVLIKVSADVGTLTAHGLNTAPVVFDTLLQLVLGCEPRHVTVMDSLPESLGITWLRRWMTQSPNAQDSRVSALVPAANDFVNTREAAGAPNILRAAAEADVRVVVPALKHHPLLGLFGAARACLSWIGGRGVLASRARLEFADSHLPCHLAVIDASCEPAPAVRIPPDGIEPGAFRSILGSASAQAADRELTRRFAPHWRCSLA